MKNSISKSRKKGIALYYQVENSIREKIENGEWKVGQKLPPTEPVSLCQFFGVSRTTIRQAVDSLVSAGLLAKKQGSGTYVTQASTARNHLNFQPSNIVCQYIYSPFLQSDMEHCYKNLLLDQYRPHYHAAQTETSCQRRGPFSFAVHHSAYGHAPTDNRI
ncbi:MAG: GntR family transcriptional regulator [Dorea sp.]